MLAKTSFYVLAENYVLDRMQCLKSGFKGVRFADLASLVKPKHFITEISPIWYFSFGSLCCLFWCHFFKLFFTFYLCFYDIGSDDKVTLWERAARLVYNMFSVPCQVLTRATFIIVDLCYDRN